MAFKHPLLILHLVISLTQTLHGVATLVSSWSLHPDTSLQGCKEDFERKTVDCFALELNYVPQHLPEDIEGLVLLLNNITSLLSSSFRRYPRITDLDLSMNDIRVIESTALHPLKDLTHLDISSNVHLVLPSRGLLRWARKLSFSDLSGSKLTSIPDDILKWSRNLKTVQLGFNLLKVINISSCGKAGNVDLSYNLIENLTEYTFNFVCNSDTLDLTKKNIRSVDPNVIASLNVRSLILGWRVLNIEELRNIFIGISLSSVIERFTLTKGTDLSVVPKDLFDPLRDCSLRILDLNNNQLHAPYPFVFSSLTRLRQFHLQENGIVTIEPNYFEGMHNLRMLDLKDNRIKDINTDNVSWTIDLTELHLSGNALTRIRESAFRGLHNLTLLDLRSNGLLKIVWAKSFLELKSIQSIDLSQCDIQLFKLMIPNVTSLFLNDMIHDINSFMNPFSFEYVELLERLEMRNIGIRIEHLWWSFMDASLFNGMFNLKFLDLSENRLNGGIDGDLPPEVLQQLSALQNLSLEDCDLSNLHPQAFTGLKSLRVLILSNNKLQQLHVDLFKPIDQVTSIDLADNVLTYLDGAIFFSNRKLKTLDLSNNKLTRLEQNTFKPLYSSLLFIDLSMNPVDCNCDLSWFPKWLSGPLNLIDGDDDDDRTICSSDSLSPLRGEYLIDFDPREFCSINITLVCLPTLAIICLIFIVALVYHYRWPLRYRLFLVKLAAVGYEEMRDARDHDDYEYDLNVIFYDDDEDWIREHLRPALAERLPQFQRNVFGDADLVLGMHYLDSVDYVVSHSYKTIVVLSSAAVRDRWFILKFRTAMDHVSDTLTEFVVVVFLEDIPDDEMPFLARLYLSDGRPYIHWTEDVRGHEYFFDKLTKSLTINLRTNDRIPNE